jgi:hypothetical protein
VFGLADGTTFVADQNLRQRRAPDAIRSRVAAAFMGTLHVLLALSYVAAAVVVPAIGPQATYAIGGVSSGLAVFVLLRMRRYLREEEPTLAVGSPIDTEPLAPDAAAERSLEAAS